MGSINQSYLLKPNLLEPHFLELLLLDFLALLLGPHLLEHE
jgi:hypothetical protein